MKNRQFDQHKQSSLSFHRTNQRFGGQILWRLLGVGSYCRPFDKSPFFLSICSPMANSIFTRCASNRYISRYARNSICCLRQRVSIAPFLLAPQDISSALALYRVADISSDALAAHIDVGSSCETHDGLDMGQEYKRYIFTQKTGVVKPKGIIQYPILLLE